MLQEWINVSEKRFNEILSTVTEAKNKGLKINVNEREIALDEAESLLKDVGSGKVDGHEFEEKFNKKVDDVETILNMPMLTRNQNNMLKILWLLEEIIRPKVKKTDEQPDTTDMPELESGESSEQRRNQTEKGLQILTPS